ncbi:MAG: hypothetical protein MRZ79_20725 [Bacteroidia bacterium]|nr:hypothetical protein [Bacteroidia bacterium]
MNMEKLILILAIGLSMIGLQSCNNPNCDNVDCGEFGTCVELTETTACRCDAGYEKDDDELCTLKSSDRFVGNWSVTELRFDNNNFTQDTLNYDVVISDDDNQANQIRFSNLGNLDNSTCGFSEPIELLATISVQTISFVSATYCPAAGFTGYNIQTLGGRDTISDSGDRIQLDFLLSFSNSQGDQNFDCNVTLERK